MEMAPFFYIIVVSYNAGKKLQETIDSIQKQSFTDCFVLIKDGGSEDGSVEEMRSRLGCSEETGLSESGTIRLVSEKDNGIYDAMNSALNILLQEFGTDFRNYAAPGPFVYFLNCGDYFKSEDVLQKVHDAVLQEGDLEGRHRSIFYGDIYERKTGQRVSSNPKIDDFALYRNVPCHQACFYDMELMQIEHFDTTWKIRADYEHFLRSYYLDHAQTFYIPAVIADYEGGGFSEAGEAAKRSEAERRQIVARYMPASKVRKYDLLRMLTLAPLRTKIAQNPVTAGIYNKIKRAFYHTENGEK